MKHDGGVGRSSGRPWCVYICKQVEPRADEEHAAYGVGSVGTRLPQLGAAE